MLSKTLLVFLPAIIAASSINIENKIYTEGSAQVKNQSSATVNGQTISVTSDQPGSVSVELKDGHVDIVKDQQSKPTIIITGVGASDITIEKTVVPVITQSIDASQIDKIKNEAKPVLEIIRQFLVKFFRNLGFGGKKN